MSQCVVSNMNDHTTYHANVLCSCEICGYLYVIFSCENVCEVMIKGPFYLPSKRFKTLRRRHICSLNDAVLGRDNDEAPVLF